MLSAKIVIIYVQIFVSFLFGYMCDWPGAIISGDGDIFFESSHSQLIHSWLNQIRWQIGFGSCIPSSHKRRSYTSVVTMYVWRCCELLCGLYHFHLCSSVFIGCGAETNVLESPLPELNVISRGMWACTSPAHLMIHQMPQKWKKAEMSGGQLNLRASVLAS